MDRWQITLQTLKGALELDMQDQDTVVVDMGAVKFVIKGADIMSPGITNQNAIWKYCDNSR